VLRRLVPEWLRDPQLRVFVVSHTEASPKHGGGGALYVTIRRRRSLRA
jgi:DNA-nicking Smr family endonuclease